MFYLEKFQIERVGNCLYFKHSNLVYWKVAFVVIFVGLGLGVLGVYL